MLLTLEYGGKCRAYSYSDTSVTKLAETSLLGTAIRATRFYGDTLWYSTHSSGIFVYSTDDPFKSRSGPSPSTTSSASSAGTRIIGLTPDLCYNSNRVCESVRRSALLVCIAALALAPFVSARTWRVPSECPTINAGLNSASYGDTVLVAPGTYITSAYDPQTRIWPGAGVTLIGEGGRDVTTIAICDGVSRDPTRQLRRSSGFRVLHTPADQR